MDLRAEMAPRLARELDAEIRRHLDTRAALSVERGERAREVERLTAERDALRGKARALYDAADLLLAEAEGMGGSYGATRDGLRAALAAIREEVKRP